MNEELSGGIQGAGAWENMGGSTRRGLGDGRGKGG